MTVLVASTLLLAVVHAQVDFTLVQGGRDVPTPSSRLIVPSRTVRLRDHTRKHRELPNVIFAPVEGSRVLTKTAFINANSKETNDEAFKIYEHFLATKGQSVLAQIADPFFVTQPPERTTIATPSERRAATRRHPFDSVGVPTTTVPTFTMATVTIQESGPPPRNDTQQIRQFVAGRSLRREEQRYPAEAKPVVRARMIASPVVGHQPSSLVAPPRDLSAAPTALPLAARSSFPQAVQSPFRAQFPSDQLFTPDLRNPDEVAWANYLAARYNEQNRRPFRPTTVGGAFTRNRQPGRPIPLPNPARIEMMSDPDVFYAPPPASPFDFEEEQKRLNLKKISKHRNLTEAGSPQHQLTTGNLSKPQLSPMFPQQSLPYLQLYSPHRTSQQPFFPNSFVDRNTQRFTGQQEERESTQQSQQQQQFTTIAPAPTLISQPPPPHAPFGFLPTTTQPPPFQRPQPPLALPNPLDLFTPPPPPPQQPPPAFAPTKQPVPVHSVTVSRPRSALSPNQKLDSCCRKQGVNPICQNLCNFDSFNDKTLVSAFLTAQCPGDQMGKAFDCASTKADHNECCVRGGLGSFLGGKCLPFCNTHKDTPANVLDYLPCLQVFRVIRDCFQEYQRVNPNIFGD
ncbi:hypothetical protein PRIPAC_89110 [Pristionchus pacificus]|uniref:DB domain-containing protein n=1 Tax=Pristionchus pacificus TaxID=54126 RepID=A0A2A6CX71_PRIPA|nr:hypothetical protein PRIPAC_89110 [Pristionchus pacificus]|eukprot:PDM82822.1 hypothetical protein PRIPAC_37215 [Pristionchus pacificus]